MGENRRGSITSVTSPSQRGSVSETRRASTNGKAGEKREGKDKDKEKEKEKEEKELSTDVKFVNTIVGLLRCNDLKLQFEGECWERTDVRQRERKRENK